MTRVPRFFAGPDEQKTNGNFVKAFMNLLQFGNRLLDTSDVVFAERVDDATKLLLRGGHEVILDGEVGNVVWSRLASRLLDQMSQSAQVE